MSKFYTLIVGMFIGGAAIHFFISFNEILDDGIARTYRCDQLDREDDARRSAEKIIQHILIDRALADLEAVTSAAGLKMQRYDKLDHVEIVVGHSVETAALYFEATLDGKISAVSVPGSIPCKNLEGGSS